MVTKKFGFDLDVCVPCPVVSLFYFSKLEMGWVQHIFLDSLNRENRVLEAVILTDPANGMQAALSAGRARQPAQQRSS